MTTGSPPISTTSASATGRSGSGAVTPKLIPASLSMSSGRPVKVMTGCRARGSAPARTAGSSTARPWRPLACATRRPSRSAPVAASPATSPGRTSSGTVSSTRSAADTTCAGCLIAVPGRSRRIPRRGASDTADAATTSWPARRSAAASAVPARPAPTTPTRSWAGCSDGPGPSRMVGLSAFINVPVLAGYRTATISISGPAWLSDAWLLPLAGFVLAAGRCGGAAAVLQVGRGRDQARGRGDRRSRVDGVAPRTRLVDGAQGVGQEPGAEPAEHGPAQRAGLRQGGQAGDGDRRERLPAPAAPDPGPDAPAADARRAREDHQGGHRGPPEPRNPRNPP